MNSTSAFIRSLVLSLLLLAGSTPANAGITLPSPKTKPQPVAGPASTAPTQIADSASSVARRGDFSHLDIFVFVLRLFLR